MSPLSSSLRGNRLTGGSNAYKVIAVRAVAIGGVEVFAFRGYRDELVQDVSVTDPGPVHVGAFVLENSLGIIYPSRRQYRFQIDHGGRKWWLIVDIDIAQLSGDLRRLYRAEYIIFINY